MVKAGLYVQAMALNSDATKWRAYMTVSTSDLDGSPRSVDTEAEVNVSDNEGQVRATLIAAAKAVAEAQWGITFSGNDTVQAWICNRAEG